MRVQKKREPTITYPRLKKDVDKLIDWYEATGKDVSQIALHDFQYRVFVEHHPEKEYRGYKINSVIL